MMLRNRPSLQVTDGRALPRKMEDIRGSGWNIVSIGTDLADKRMEGGSPASMAMCECATVRGPASQCFASEQLARKRV